MQCAITQLFQVNFLDKKTVFTPEQAAGMFLHKMKEITEHGLGEKVNDCVISVRREINVLT